MPLTMATIHPNYWVEKEISLDYRLCYSITLNAVREDAAKRSKVWQDEADANPISRNEKPTCAAEEISTTQSKVATTLLLSKVRQRLTCQYKEVINLVTSTAFANTTIQKHMEELNMDMLTAVYQLAKRNRLSTTEVNKCFGSIFRRGSARVRQALGRQKRIQDCRIVKVVEIKEGTMPVEQTNMANEKRKQKRQQPLMLVVDAKNTGTNPHPLVIVRATGPTLKHRRRTGPIRLTEEDSLGNITNVSRMASLLRPHVLNASRSTKKRKTLRIYASFEPRRKRSSNTAKKKQKPNKKKKQETTRRGMKTSRQNRVNSKRSAWENINKNKENKAKCKANT